MSVSFYEPGHAFGGAQSAALRSQDLERTGLPESSPGAAEGRRVGLRDGCGRRIDHLRLSVISACDMRCVYCRPHGHRPGGHTCFSDEQRLEFVRFLHGRFGLSQLRITGGEPLQCPSLARFIAAIRAALRDVSIALTTNGCLLAKRAVELRRAGLDCLNVSLDSLDAERYRCLTGGVLREALAGLQATAQAGFPPPKINTVVLRGLNDDEICDLARWALAAGLEIRFLEAMPIGPAADLNRRRFVSAAEIRDRLAREFDLVALPETQGATARRYRVSGAGCAGAVGLIAPISQPFCDGCRRMRLTAEGELYPCLLDSHCVDMSAAWGKEGFCPATAERLVEEAVVGKRPQGPRRQTAAMVAIGG
jgi:cyclic pyranopterin phosphate synthase